MPILKREIDLYPADLLENERLLQTSRCAWWCLYTISRREKDLMRRLMAMDIPFYGPVVEKRYRSPSGRLRTSFVPLFPNYVFLFGPDEQRAQAMTTGCVSRHSRVAEPEQLVRDLRQIFCVIQAGIPLTPEAKLQAGNQVRVKAGPFAGYEGMVIRREGRTRLLLAVRFLEQGVSMEIDEGLLEAV